MTSGAMILETLDEAATAVAGRHTDEWPGWVAYFLEALEIYTDAETMDRVLERIERMIHERRKQRGW